MLTRTSKILCVEEMIRGLNQVSWERIDVSFHKSRQRYVAHNTIQVSFLLELNSIRRLVYLLLISCAQTKLAELIRVLLLLSSS